MKFLSKVQTKIFIANCLAATCLIFYALYNTYPIVDSDSGSYISNGFDFNNVPIDRPIAYSVFLRHISLWQSLWFPVFAQSFILAWLVWIFIRNVFNRIALSEYLGIVVFTVIFSSVSWCASQLMPDIFTPVLCLAFVNYLLNTKYRLQNIFLIAVGAIMHNSNLITLTLAVCLILCLSIFFKRLKLYRRKLIVIAVTSLTCWLSICTYHYVYGYGFRPSRSSHIFLMGALCESGLLKKYLEEHCDKEHLKLCAFKDELPQRGFEFIWVDNSILKQTGGWDSSAGEYNKITTGILTDPHLVTLLAMKSIQRTAIQLAQLKVDYIQPQMQQSNVYQKIRSLFKDEFNDYCNSRQNSGQLNSNEHNNFYIFSLLFSIALVLFLPKKYALDDNFLLAYLVVISCIVLNAFTTATFANILSRLNNRIVWLLLFLNLVYLFVWARNFIRINGTSKY